MLIRSLCSILIISLTGLGVVSFTLFIRRLLVNSSNIYNKQREMNEKLDHLIQLFEERKAEKGYLLDSSWDVLC